MRMTITDVAEVVLDINRSSPTAGEEQVIDALRMRFSCDELVAREVLQRADLLGAVVWNSGKQIVAVPHLPRGEQQAPASGAPQPKGR